MRVQQVGAQSRRNAIAASGAVASTRDDTGTITAAQMTDIKMFQNDADLYIDRLNIQRAQSAVLVTVGGIEYAIVADDNNLFMDPYWKAMYEMPNFIYAPDGPPIALGGSANAKKVNVGGKLGIVKDPFGPTPTYLGATLPIDGYSIVNLSLSEDGKVLLGQLNGGFSGKISQTGAGGSYAFPSQSHVWEVEALIKATLEMSDKDRRTDHIDLPKIAEQLLKDNIGRVAGTYFDPDDVKLEVEGRLGDIIQVDLKRHVAHALLGLPAPDEINGALDTALVALYRDDIKELMNHMNTFQFVAGEKDLLKENTRDLLLTNRAGRRMTLVTDANGQEITGTEQNFVDSGMMHLAPYLTQNDMDKLRVGERLSPFSHTQNNIFLTYNLSKDVGDIKAGQGKIDLTVSASDYPATKPSAFFGDRPLDNPGYSAFTLNGSVGIGTANNLDVWRVEQRLKYLGFPAMGADNPTVGNNTLKDFVVDGNFEEKEQRALKLFEKIVRYTSDITATGTGRSTTRITTADGSASAFVKVTSNATMEGPNACNVIGSEVVNTELVSTIYAPGLSELQRASALVALNFIKDNPSVAQVAEARELAIKNAKINADSTADDSTSFKEDSPGADGKIDAGDEQANLTTSWLNAYNAPHWMDIGSQMQWQGPRDAPALNDNGYTIQGWNNSQNGAPPASAVEKYGTSWARDLMVAVGMSANSELPGSRYEYNGATYTYLFKGAVDANYGFTPKWNGANLDGQHKTHDLGMAFDLGISNLVTPAHQGSAGDDPTLTEAQLANTPHPVNGTRLSNMPDINAYNDKRWSLANAIYLSGFLSEATNNNQKAALHEFLSLYALTQGDSIGGNGTWDDLPIKNGEAVRAALFGSGIKTGSLISGVHIGDASLNSYEDIREILTRLGIYATTEPAHQHHFHIYLNPPTPQRIVSTLLLSGNPLAMPPDTSSGSVTLAATTNTQALFDYTQTLIEGEELMFTLDVPYVPLQEAPVVLVQATAITSQPDYLLKTCDEASSGGEPAIDPAAWLVGAVLRQNGRQVSSHEFGTLETTVKLTQLQGVKHGQLIPHSPDGRVFYKYRSEPGYVGKDQAIFMAEYEGKRYKIIANVVVSMNINENDPQCPPPKLIKLKKPATPSSGVNEYDLNAPISTISTQASTSLVAGITVTFADLEGAALGQTTGSTITLDTNAANYNWFIDPTPGQNEEYLPTSNPNEWVAKAGSDAAGKMDMLSVLLHEYGHALGINHNPDSHDYMATTLTPGVRRLPTAEELALMQRLVGRVKEEMVAGSTSTLSPASGGGEFPTLPLGTSFIGFLGLLRSSRYGGVSIVPDENTLVTQYDWAANATLTNGNLNSADGWSTQGSVDIANGAAVMREVSTTQTRLSQVFQLNPTDRFLSFTLSGAALDDMSGAPLGKAQRAQQSS